MLMPRLSLAAVLLAIAATLAPAPVIPPPGSDLGCKVHIRAVQLAKQLQQCLRGSSVAALALPVAVEMRQRLHPAKSIAWKSDEMGVTLDMRARGATFEGVGALSGGGGTSRYCDMHINRQFSGGNHTFQGHILHYLGISNGKLES